MTMLSLAQGDYFWRKSGQKQSMIKKNKRALTQMVIRLRSKMTIIRETKWIANGKRKDNS